MTHGRFPTTAACDELFALLREGAGGNRKVVRDAVLDLAGGDAAETTPALMARLMTTHGPDAAVSMVRAAIAKATA